ncbi:YciI family protein [Paraburkholderia dipogonis]|uniref:YciI family protein n=1 Tax=Paraburkholderia dipogonis TaxID=1211383 RepID=UPI0038B6E7EE
MLYSFYNIDAPGTDLRATLRPAHREYLAKFAEQFAFAGPLLAEDGVTPVGSLLVLDFETVEEANAFIKAEPYTVAGLYASVSMRPFLNLWQQRKGFPEPR